ncbi:DNA binding protein [Bacillus phage Eoghan]|uniref:Uncharacterized protein n=2 Tax=Andromedavirus TaxID=1623275 RepID=M1HN50_9CAUD|nr:DNA binding protein [Bacillus phage Eoghan]YP_009592283.1 DNA binding protein [Bacillus phage Taylor]AGE60814.1 hypothetical protein EOGHAN_51 [Bacillus phage Eoghan]AGE60968.1 hypothetical protein TAYLOR_50 [Bacillus phage Taylor]
MTNGVGEEKTISVRNNLIEIYGMIKCSKSLTLDEINIISERILKVTHQVARIHDKLEDACNDGWGLEETLDKIADELYMDGEYVDEV